MHQNNLYISNHARVLAHKCSNFILPLAQTPSVVASFIRSGSQSHPPPSKNFRSANGSCLYRHI